MLRFAHRVLSYSGKLSKFTNNTRKEDYLIHNKPTKEGSALWQHLWRWNLDQNHGRKLSELYDKAKMLDQKLHDFDSIGYELQDIADLYAYISSIIDLFKSIRIDQQQLSKSDINFYSRIIVESSVFLDSFNYAAEAMECRKLVPCPALRAKVLESAEVYKLSPPV